MTNVINHIISTLIGLFFIGVAFYFEWETWEMFAFIGIGIILLFAKDELPAVIRKATDKFLSK